MLDLLPPELSDLEKDEARYHSQVASFWDELAQCNTVRNRTAHFDFLQEIEKVGPQALVLEVGCGTGWDGRWLLQKGILVLETDIAQASLVHALERATAAELQARAMFARATARCLPFPSDTFDAVFSVATLHHLEDLSACLHEITRCVKPGGLVVFAVEPNRLWHGVAHYTKPVFRSFLRWMGRADPHGHSLADESARGFSRRCVRELVEEAGLAVEHVRPVWFTQGFLHVFLQAWSKISKPMNPTAAPTAIENILYRLDESLRRIRFLDTLCWHWNCVARKSTNSLGSP